MVPTSFVDVDSFGKTSFRFIAVCPSLSLQEIELGGRDDISPCDLIAQHGIAVLSTVVRTSFVGVDSIDNEIQVYCYTSFIIVVGGRIRGEG